MNGNRHKTQTMAEEADGPDEDTINEFVNAVETCLAHREDIQPILTDIRQELLRGEPVQERVDELCEAEPALIRIGMTAKMVEIPKLLSIAEAQSRLSEADADAFEAFWDRNDWIEEGIYAHFLEQKHDCTYWTNGDISLENRDGDHYVRHRFEWGLDEVHDIEAPLAEAWNDLVNRLRALVRIASSEQADLTEEEREHLQDSASALQQVAEQVAAEPSEGDDASGGASDLGQLFEDRSGDDEDDSEERAAEEEHEESLIGFQ